MGRLCPPSRMIRHQSACWLEPASLLGWWTTGCAIRCGEFQSFCQLAGLLDGLACLSSWNLRADFSRPVKICEDQHPISNAEWRYMVTKYQTLRNRSVPDGSEKTFACQARATHEASSATNLYYSRRSFFRMLQEPVRKGPNEPDATGLRRCAG